jgi:hypothetical protein
MRLKRYLSRTNLIVKSNAVVINLSYKEEAPIVTDKYLRQKIWKLRESAEKHRIDRRPGRRRFGVYRFLGDVYETYLGLRSRRIAKTATRRIAKRMHLGLRRNSHPIRVLIEASASGEDNRTKSRWTQALKYAHGWLQPPDRLTWFFDVNGGISGAAAKYAKLQKAKKSGKSGQEPRAPNPLEPGRRAELPASHS